MKFAHIADTHIRNLKFHYEYRKVFDRLYEILKEQEVDYIIHCGDIAHTKTQISPEFVEMAAGFFTNLAAIAPTYIILGNHDGNLKLNEQEDRQAASLYKCCSTEFSHHPGQQWIPSQSKPTCRQAKV